jgi:dTDP-4-amino-4,6-dideoxygalactose transaminase|tara:strand:+ start:44 stop:1150 length:1107 start_codon:yes stop_codon:yes gene_type:complete
MIKFIPISRMYDIVKEQYYSCLDEVYREDNQFEGTYCKKSEQKLQDITGRKHALLVTSGTAGILAMLLAQGVKPGDEVICINYSCPATVMPIKVLGANPVFVDIDRHGQMDLSNVKSKITDRTTAILTTGLYGDTFDYDAIKDIGIPILNDSAQSVFNKYKGQENTKLGRMSILSFSTNKNIPVFGTYGAVFTDDDQLAKDLYVIRRNGYLNRDVGNAITHIGFNAQPHADKSAQLYCSLQHAEQFQKRREEIANYYHKELAKQEISIRPSPAYSKSNNHKFTILVDNKFSFRDRMKNEGVETQLHYTYNFAKAPVFSHAVGSFPYTDLYVRHAISIPCSPWHTDAEIETVVDAIKKSATKGDKNVQI